MLTYISRQPMMGGPEAMTINLIDFLLCCPAWQALLDCRKLGKHGILRLSRLIRYRVRLEHDFHGDGVQEGRKMPSRLNNDVFLGVPLRETDRGEVGWLNVVFK